MRTAVLVCLFAALAVSANQVPQPFKSGQTYVYGMRTQVSSSLLGSSPTELTNQAMTGLQAQVRLTFTSDRNLRMQLEHIRMAELNGDVSAYQQNNKQQLVPSELLEKRQMPAEMKQKLELPVAVSLVDGVVERIQFHESDSSAWSKNIKRAVLNMLQLNLKRNDVQGLAMESSVPKDEKEQQDLSVFTVPEITLEGQCETIYTIQKPQQGKFYDESGEESSSFTPFNVTKNVNFNKCQRTADVSYGFQTNVAQQLRCLKCLRQANGQKFPGSTKDPRHEEQLKITHCQSECQTNQLANSESVERSTVARYEVVGKPQKYAIRRTQIISQYVVKAQNPTAQNTISQVVAISELVFKEQSDNQHVEAFKPSSTEETLLYSAEWDLNERRFYMYGDEEFDQKRSPFAKVHNKEEDAAAAVREIIKQWEEDKEMGYELNSAIVFNKLVTVLRQSSVEELKTIEQAILSTVTQQKESKQSLEHAKSLFHDALAVAATRNSLNLLKQKIQQQEISTVKAAELVKVFVANQHSPSDRQADILEQIATSESAQRCPVLKQTAQLSFGAAVGKICQKQPAQSQNHEFRTEILCPEGKKEQYKKTLIQQWRQAETVYDQILALKTIGNAALTKCLPELEKIIKDKRQPTLIRMEAIDALRRLRTGVPEKIQQILLPTFADQRDQPEVRMAALSMLLYTQPEPAILDQVIFSVQQDRSQNVRSYVLSALDSLSKSPSSAEQKIAQHLKASLKITKINGEQTRSSLKYRVPIYVSEQENTEEQNVFLGLASIVSPSNLFPVHLAASIRSAFNGEATQERLQLSFSQKDLEHVYEKLANTFERYYANDKEDKESGERQSAKDLRSIYSSLGIKSRRTGSYYLSSEESDESSESAKRSTKMGNNSPFGMIVIRSNDVDQVIVPVDEHHLPHQLRKYLNGERNALTSFSEQYGDLKQALANGKHFRQHVAVSLAETKTKVPTSAGLPLAIIWQTTGVGSVEGRVRAQLQLSERKFDAELEVRASGIATHKHKIEVWTPLIVSGVKSMRTIELNAAPFKVEIKANDRQIELIVEPPTEQKDRVLGLHTLPATYTQKFKWQSRTYEEPRLRTVRNRHLEQTQQEYHIGEQHNHAIRFEGNVHKVSSVKQLIHALYTTENNLHIFYKPGSETPTRVTARISGFSFRQSDKHTGPQFDDFYTPKDSRKHFRSLYDDEEEKTTKSSEEQQDADYRQHMQFPSNQQRHSKLSSFVGRYSAKEAYQHRLKVEVEARCPAKKHSAELDLQAQCDHRMEHCKIAVNAQRTPLGSESSNWQLQAKLETVAPETVRNEEDPEEKHSRMLVKANAEWGPEAQSKVNSVEVRIQAEPTRKTYWRADSADKWSRFLNKIDLVADYQLRSPQRHYVQRVYELVKARNFWQIQVDGDRKGEENRVRASLLINPFTRQANLTIQTPQERVRAEMIQLPRKIQPMPLAQRPTSYQSLSHVIKSYVQSGAECQADDRRIKTFDGVSYRAPLSECYSVLAKDCSREDPRFVVLMKKSDEQTKVKIITKEDDIELQKESDSYKITVKVNGRKVEDEEQLAKHGVEKFEGQVYVNQRGVSVRFDGEEAKIKISGIYKNIQCGLCGHYSDEADVFRMSNNRRTPSLKEFHRSYTLKNQECDERQLNKFYEQTNSEEFQLRPRKQKSVYYRDSSYEQNDYEEQYGSSEQEWWSSKEDKKKGEKVKPVDRTHVLEYEHKVCFSTEPVKRCPRGTVNDEDSEERKQTKVQFFCLDRKSSEARRLHRQVRQGKVVDAEGYALSFFDTVAQDSKCQQQQIEAY